MVWIYQAAYEDDAGRSRRETEHELGRALLKRALKERYGVRAEPGQEPELGTGAHGKPYLENYPQIHFNISHCKGRVVCAVGDEVVGIDVEQIHPYKDGVLRKVLSPIEKEQMETAAEVLKQELFFRFWTLKESYVKAVGCGITVPLTEISFRLGEEGSVAGNYPGWRFWQMKMAGDYILSVCTAEEGEITLAEWEEQHGR